MGLIQQNGAIFQQKNTKIHCYISLDSEESNSNAAKRPHRQFIEQLSREEAIETAGKIASSSSSPTKSASATVQVQPGAPLILPVLNGAGGGGQLAAGRVSAPVSKQQQQQHVRMDWGDAEVRECCCFLLFFVVFLLS